MKLVGVAALALLACAACKDKVKAKDQGQAAATAVKPPLAPPALDAAAAPAPPVAAARSAATPATGPAAALVGVWSPFPEIVDGKYHDVAILRADGTYEWRATELECVPGIVRLVGTWKLDGDRLAIETTQITAWEGDGPDEDPQCTHAGKQLALTAQVEVSREPTGPCAAEIEYSGPGGVMTRAKPADLKFPCLQHGMDFKFKVAAVEAFEAAHPPLLPAVPAVPLATDMQRDVLDKMQDGSGNVGSPDGKPATTDVK